MRVVLRDRQQWGSRGVVSTGSSAATLAALRVLEEGGTAFDAAITASAMMTVCMPMASGPGGDATAVLHVGGKRTALALVGLGRAPRSAHPQAFGERGLDAVPRTGVLSATTPALLDAWFEVHERFGTLPLERLLRPALRTASEGAVITGQFQRWTRENLHVLEQPEFRGLYGRAAEADSVGTSLPQPGLARLLDRAGRESREALNGWIAELAHEVSARHGGFLRGDDVTATRACLVPALDAQVAGRKVAVPPAPTQGPLMLQNLALYGALLSDGVDSGSAPGIHLLAETVHQTFGWRLDHLRDPESAGPPMPDPLGADTLAALLSGIDPDRRTPCRYTGHYSHGDTTHLVVADRAGNAVTWVQSLGLGFGAGVGLPEAGLLLCNRLGRSATLDHRHANRVTPGARPVNTIFPWTISEGPAVRWLGGTPGGDGQCQWNTQVAAALLFDDSTALRALSRPRWTYFPGSDRIEAGRPEQLHVDETMEPAAVAELVRRGHDVVRKASVGGVNRVVSWQRGSLYGLDDGRQEGLTAAC
ncbi:gamma-glutamyltransferase [Streptomyces camelliae]|uniref:Gamma-glutamyltransferase n=1 Tax=Streptomyces camelliae TaxID=3004093 RepID=A0ABY7PI21_9ACTN|nr:gamma-glutamyltransferase [Streptomyces sp. HUAS 2-6]WBO69629.1 gamma-glutamyltransferase [Streptomyces sp. HUAS 2-6]